MKYVVWILVVLLVFLHQDYWQWNRSDLVFGFLPYPLAYHMLISLATAGVWVLAIKFCWPADDDLTDGGLTDGDVKSPDGARMNSMTEEETVDSNGRSKPNKESS